MILGIGNDLVDIRRIEKALARHGTRFVARCFAPEERVVADRRQASGLEAHTYAKRFAAKEACAKALGTGFRHGVFMRDIAVVNDEDGRPHLRLSGGAFARLQALLPAGRAAVVHLSFSDEPPYAAAYVIIEAR